MAMPRSPLAAGAAARRGGSEPVVAMSLGFERRDASRVELRGALVFASAAAAHAEGLRHLAAVAAGGGVDFDCAALSDADSAGLAVLIEWKAAARRRGVRLRYTALPDSLVRLARISDVERLLLAG